MLLNNPATDRAWRVAHRLPRFTVLSAVAHAALAVLVVMPLVDVAHPQLPAPDAARQLRAPVKPVMPLRMPALSPAPTLTAAPLHIEAAVPAPVVVRIIDVDVLRRSGAPPTEDTSAQSDEQVVDTTSSSVGSETSSGEQETQGNVVTTPPDIGAFALRFVHVEDGRWIQWLRARGGLVGLSGRRDGRIERVYSADGDPVAQWVLSEYWPLEIDRPNAVAALRPILRRDRLRSGGRAGPRRVFALFPGSFENEVLAAIRTTSDVAGDAVAVAFGPDSLLVVPTPLAAGQQARGGLPN